MDPLFAQPLADLAFPVVEHFPLRPQFNQRVEHLVAQFVCDGAFLPLLIGLLSKFSDLDRRLCAVCLRDVKALDQRVRQVSRGLTGLLLLDRLFGCLILLAFFLLAGGGLLLLQLVFVIEDLLPEPRDALLALLCHLAGECSALLRLPERCALNVDLLLQLVDLTLELRFRRLPCLCAALLFCLSLCRCALVLLGLDHLQHVSEALVAALSVFLHALCHGLGRLVDSQALRLCRHGLLDPLGLLFQGGVAHLADGLCQFALSLFQVLLQLCFRLFLERVAACRSLGPLHLLIKFI